MYTGHVHRQHTHTNTEIYFQFFFFWLSMEQHRPAASHKTNNPPNNTNHELTNWRSEKKTKKKKIITPKMFTSHIWAEKLSFYFYCIPVSWFCVDERVCVCNVHFLLLLFVSSFKRKRNAQTQLNASNDENTLFFRVRILFDLILSRKATRSSAIDKRIAIWWWWWFSFYLFVPFFRNYFRRIRWKLTKNAKFIVAFGRRDEFVLFFRLLASFGLRLKFKSVRHTQKITQNFNAMHALWNVSIINQNAGVLAVCVWIRVSACIWFDCLFWNQITSHANKMSD